MLAKQYFLAIIILLILSGYAAWFISKNLTKKIEAISKKLTKTNVEYLDTPIDYSENDEIKPLVESYNSMLGKLQEQTNQLAKNEREEGWREMGEKLATKLIIHLYHSNCLCRIFRENIILMTPKMRKK